MDAHVQLYSNIEVKFILLQKNPLNLNSRPYTAVGVVAARTVCGSSDEYHLFTPKHGGEIVLSSGALSSPQLLRQSIILPENFSLENLHPKSDMLDLLRSSSSNDVFHIPEIGSSLLDHTILPFICLGNWRVPIDQLFSSFPFFQKKEFPITFESPPNSVHGWIFLNGSGEIYNPHESYVPPRYFSLNCWIIYLDHRIQLVFIDGRILCGSMFAEMLLPRFNATWYESSVRPFLFNVIQVFNFHF